jgi:hypothetical protein
MTDLDPMDRRLREYAERWRLTMPPPPGVDLEQLSRGRGRTWSLVLASAAAIAVMILGATQLVGNDAPDEPDRPSTAPTEAPTAAPSASEPDNTVGEMPLTRFDALRRALAADQAVRWNLLYAEPSGQFLCGLHVLGSSTRRDTLYVWLTCGDFLVANGAATMRSGGDGPAVVKVRGRGTDIQVVKVTFPRQQSLEADITRLFPAALVDRVLRGNIQTSPSTEELRAEAATNGSVGTRVALPTHCGVVSLRIGKVLWLADPPLGDDSHNPPPGWDENRTPGIFVRTGPDTGTFLGDGGQRAQFRLAAKGEADPAAGCE